MLAPVQIEEHIKGRKFNYKHLISNVATSPKKGNYDLCFYIPVRNRLHFFGPFYHFFQKARKKSDLAIKLVVIEEDTASHYNMQTKDKDLEYIFIPSEHCKSDGQFAKSLCYNLAFLQNQKTPYHIFHDLDIVIDESYFKLIEHYIEKGITWLQPYSGKRVMRVGGGATGRIVKDPNSVTILDAIKDMNPANPGSPGGSILVKREDFINVGGYDPELFFGYSPEDSFFWAKLEVLHGAEGPFQNHFQGKGVYADDPKMDVYHLDHPVAENTNPYYGRMLEILHSFFMYGKADRLKILDIKKQYLGEALQ